jgi:general stress protein YciG
MAGTHSGGLKTRDKNLKKNPNFYRDIAKLGGLAKVPKGFACMDKDKVIEAGRLGGKVSKRPKNKPPMNGSIEAHAKLVKSIVEDAKNA